MRRFIPHIQVLLAAVILIACLAGCGKMDGKRSTISFRIASVATKGQIVTTENISTVYPSFKTDVWVAPEDLEKTEADEHYIDNETVTYNEETKYWDLENEERWLGGINLCFWSWAPIDAKTKGNLHFLGNPSNTGNRYLSFNYYLPTPDPEGRGQDVTNQSDLLFAFNYQDDSSASGEVHIHFYHALSWIRFLVNKQDGTFGENLEIQDISLNNVYSSGDCEFRPYEDLFIEKFAWTPGLTKQSFKQNFTIADNFVPKTDNPKKDGDYVSSSSLAFMMIPQTIPSDASVTITFVRTSDNSTIERTAFFKDADTWKPGYYYTYKINAAGLDTPIDFTIEYVDWIDGGQVEF